jgi:hypothetical protein
MKTMPFKFLPFQSSFMRFSTTLLLIFAIGLFSCDPDEPIIAPDIVAYVNATMDGQEFEPAEIKGLSYNGSFEVVLTGTDNDKVTISFPTMPIHGTAYYQYPISLFYEAPGQPILYETFNPLEWDLEFTYDSVKNKVTMEGTVGVFLHRHTYQSPAPGKYFDFNFGNIPVTNTVAPTIADHAEMMHITGWNYDSFNVVATNIVASKTGSLLEFDIDFGVPGFQGSNFTFSFSKDRMAGYEERMDSDGTWIYNFAGSPFYTNSFSTFHILRHDPIGRRITMSFSGKFYSNFNNYSAEQHFGYLDVNY